MNEGETARPGAGGRAIVRPAAWPEDSSTVRRLFLEYRKWLADHSDTDPGSAPRVIAGLSEMDRLISDLPGAYAPPRGEVLLWFDGRDVVACGALRLTAPGIGEIRRISVRADYRGRAFGLPFVREFVRRARELGCTRLRADALPTMRAAIEFYEELGFRRIAAYWPHPSADALFFERDLTA